MKRVLVIGASGFIGRHTLAPLRARGFEVHAVSRGARPDGLARWHEADLLAADGLAAVLGSVRPTHLLHLAWYAEPGIYWRSARNLDYVAASLALVRAFAESGGSRFVGAGTCAEYDWSHERLVEATTPLLPATLYGASKHGLRLLIEAFARETGLSAGWGRIFLLYGPHEHPARLVPSIVRALIAGEPARCSPGTQRRDFLFVEDVAEALVALLDSDVEGPVNIASGDAVAVADVAMRIGLLMRRVDLVHLGALPAVDEPPIITGDITRLADEVCWQPRVSLDAGLERTIEWWRATVSTNAATP